MVFSLSITASASTDDESSSDNFGTTYFYDHFDNSAYRTVYKQIKEAADKFHNSSTNATYNDGGYYSAFVISIDNKNWEVIGDDGMVQIMNAILADNPEYFWMSDQYITQMERSGDLSFTSLTVECYALYANGTNREVAKNNYNIKVGDYVTQYIQEDTPDYEKVYLIHNAIINNVFCASNVTEASKDNIYTYTADGVFNPKYLSAVTYGYAKAFKAIMDEVGVPCLYIEGQNSDLIDTSVSTQKTLEETTYINNCAWNAVYLDGEWYLINVGLDDPITSTGKDARSYDYFNITDAQATNLTAIPNRLPGIPECTGTTYSISKIETLMESDGSWQKATYNFIDRILDKYGLSVVLISLGVILLLIVALIKHLHKKSKARKDNNIKKHKTSVIDNSDLDDELRRPPLS
jgi:hypothetical protein